MSALPAPDSVPTTRDDLRRHEELIAALQKAIDRMARDQEVQFTRIAQLQADIDLIRRAWNKIPPATETTLSPKHRTYTGPERRLTPRKK
jgi:hypothetical protein